MVTALASKWSQLLALREQNGTGATARLIVDRIGKHLGVAVNHIVWLDVAKLSDSVQATSDFEFRFLTPEEVRNYSITPANDLEPWLVDRAARGLDLCFAALDKGRLAAYGWYALQSIEPKHFFGLGMSYPSDVAYMYAGFTHPDYRGRRLHGLVMGLALRDLATRGVTKLVSYVDWTNVASLKSCWRLGYEDLGRMVTCGIGPLRFAKFPRAARRLDVKIGRRASFGTRKT